MQNYLILGHLGLGDHILCNGIYRHFSKISEKVVIPVKKHNLYSLQMMLLDRKNVEFFVVNETNNMKKISESVNLIFGNTHKIVKLGYFGENFLTSDDINYDENFYLQAGVPFSNRWEDFEFSINQKNANEIYKSNLKSEEYIFVHEDEIRKFKIAPKYVNSRKICIRPRQDLNAEYSIFDYYPMIKQAGEIHCIESSFAALIDSIETRGMLFCHRYARPETYEDKQLAFTYRKPWVILS
jgi:hypothetical protein